MRCRFLESNLWPLRPLSEAFFGVACHVEVLAIRRVPKA